MMEQSSADNLLIISLDKTDIWLGAYFGASQMDCDVSGFLLNDKGKLIKEEHFIFYNNLCGLGHNEDDPCEDHGCTDGDFGVKLMGDLWYEGGGGSEWWNDELFKLNLSKIPSDVYAVSFLLTIDRGKERGQTIRQMEEIKVALYEVGNEEPPFWVYSYDKCLLKDAVALELGSLIRVSNQWKFEVSGIGYAEDLEFFVSKYYDGEVQ